MIFEWEQYKDHLLDIFKIWEGGMAIYGGSHRHWLAAWVVCHFNKLNFRNSAGYRRDAFARAGHRPVGQLHESEAGPWLQYRSPLGA